MSIAASRTVLTDSSGLLLCYWTTVVQTTSVFCFCGGLFTFLNLKKKGRPGGGPYFGLLVGVLVYLLSFLSTRELFPGLFGGMLRGTTMDAYHYRLLINQQLGAGAAGGVIKVIMQLIVAIVPMIILSILARKKSTRGKMTLNTLWVLLAVPVGLTLLFLLGSVLTGNRIGSSIGNSVVTALIGGSIGGLIAYSFIHLFRRVPCFLFALFATILSATMSCLISQYLLLTSAGLRDTIWPQVITAAFDGRLILITTVLAFALRDWHEARPGSLVIAMALLAAAFVWGEINTANLYNLRAYPVSVLAYQAMRTAPAASAAAADPAAVSGLRTGTQLLLAVPPLLLGAVGAWMMKRAFDTPDELTDQ